MTTGVRRNRFGRPRRGRCGIEEDLKRLRKQELDLLFNQAFHDRERAEVVSLTESKLLRVVRGEVLRNSRYRRILTA